MLPNSKRDAFRESDVTVSLPTLKNVNAVSCRHPAGELVAGAGFEPATFRLTADRSTTELLWIALGDAEHTLASPFAQGKRRFGTKEKLLTQPFL